MAEPAFSLPNSPVHRPSAEFWLRVPAVFLDAVILWAGYLALLWASWRFAQNAGPLFVFALLSLLFVFWTMLYQKGHVPGAAILGLRVENQEGQAPSLLSA